jgi:hypothetical protein
MKKIIHVHIGKCAGGSINLGLHKLGLPFEELHCGESNNILKNRLMNDDGSNLYIISLREPIARVISSFNWDKYEKIISQRVANPTWSLIYSSFENVDALVAGYSSNNIETKKIARVAFEESQLHIQLGLAWYVPPEVALKLPPKRTVLLRTEYLNDDFQVMLSNHFPNKVYNGELPKDKDNKQFLMHSDIPRPKYLSELSKLKLKEILEEDYEVLDILYDRGMLLDKY